jgi:hypothetical protein
MNLQYFEYEARAPTVRRNVDNKYLIDRMKKLLSAVTKMQR